MIRIFRFLAIPAWFTAAAIAGMTAVQADGLPPPIPHCEPAILGATACLDGVLCECAQMRGGSISGEMSGVRWNCEALRPRCSRYQDGTVPAALPPASFPYPYSVGIDRSEETLIIDQTQKNIQGTPAPAP